MTDRGGWFVDPVPGTPPVGMAAVDGRIALSALIGSQFQVVKGGVCSVSGSSMQISVGATVWGIPDPSMAGAVFLTPTDLTTLIPAVGPGTGSRIDLIVVKQNDYAHGDADSHSHVTLVAGTASGTPSPPAVPAGAQVFATVTVPAGATTSSACTVVVAQQATLAPLRVAAPTLANLNATPGVANQTAIVYADPTTTNNGEYAWNGSAWAVSRGGPYTYTPVLGGSTTNPTLGTGGTASGWYSLQGKVCTFGASFVFGTSPNSGSGNYTVSLPLTASPVYQFQPVFGIFDKNGSADPGVGHGPIAALINSGSDTTHAIGLRLGDGTRLGSPVGMTASTIITIGGSYLTA